MIQQSHNAPITVEGQLQLQTIFEIVSKQKKTLEDIHKLKELLSFVSYFDQFKQKKEELQNAIYKSLQIRIYEVGEIIFRYGDMGECFYVILHGSVEVLIPMEMDIANKMSKKIQKEKKIQQIGRQRKQKENSKNREQQSFQKFINAQSQNPLNNAIGSSTVIQKSI